MSTVSKLIDNILNSKKKLYLAITGGGLGAISKLTENGGASTVFLGATVPYSPEDLAVIVGSASHKAVSLECARALSKAGYKAASSINVEDFNGICVASTSSLRKAGKERADREHNAFISVSKYDYDNSVWIATVSIKFLKNRTRLEEEYVLSCLILAVANAYMNGERVIFSEELQRELGIIDGELG